VETVTDADVTTVGKVFYGDGLDRYIDARIARAFRENTFTIAPKFTVGRPHADGTPATPYMEEELTFVEKPDGSLVKRGGGRLKTGAVTVTMTRREAIEQGLIEED
jgi:hypothetical protein